MISVERAFHIVPPCSSYKERSINHKMSNSGKSRKLAITLMLILLISAAAPRLIYSSILTVNTDREIYYPGESVEINGTSHEDTEVNLILNGTETLLNITLTTNHLGYYEHYLELYDNTTTGNYTLYATTGSDQVKTYIQIRETECNLYHNLEKIVAQTRTKLTQRIEELEDGEESEDLEEKLAEGDELREEAYQLMLNGSCKEAGQMMIRALNHYGEAYRESEERDDDDKGLDDIHELRVKIKRAYQFLNRLNRTSQRLEEKGYETGSVQDELETVKTMLSKAEDSLENGEIITAEEKIELAEEKLDEIFDVLKEITRERRREQAKEFVKETKERFKQLEKSLKGILNNNTSEEDIEKINEIFNNTIEQLEDVLGNIDGDDLDSVLDDLTETLEKNEDDVDDLNIPAGKMNRIKAIERHQNKIRKLREKLGEIADNELKGRIIDLLEKAESILQEAHEKVTDEDSEDLIEEAENLIDEAEELIEDWQEDKDPKKLDDPPGSNKDKKEQQKEKHDDDPDTDKEDDEDNEKSVDNNDDDTEKNEADDEDEEDDNDDANDDEEDDDESEIEVDSENLKNRGKGKKKGKNKEDNN